MSSSHVRPAPRLLAVPVDPSSPCSLTWSASRQETAAGKVITPALEDVWRQPKRYDSLLPGPYASPLTTPSGPASPSNVRVYGKTAVLGGSFDPPHWGTAWCVRRLLAAGARDVWLMPVAQHAEKKNQSPFSTRMLMAFALADHLRGEGGIPPERLLVTNVESFVDSGGQTLEVLRAMRRLYSPRSFVLAVGADVGECMRFWPQHDALEREFPVVVLERPGGYRGAQLLAHGEPAIELSSTQIRAASLAGESIDSFIPEEVLEVIKEHGLYCRHRWTPSWRRGRAALVGMVSAVAVTGAYFEWFRR